MIDIAVGSSRNQKVWKNKQFTWEQLVEKFSETHETAETFEEYLAADKERQTEIKDIGGFVGGYLTGGRRTPVTNVKHRQLITLDIDNGHPDLWSQYLMFYGNAGLVHSSHKHSSENPRYRLIIPLSRPVSREEYEAVARKIAGNLGIKYFDPTTFQPQRLMYWPSTSKGAEYYFKEKKGSFYNPDEALNSYVDWRDISAWPQCPTEKEVVQKNLSKQEDPRTKKHLIGAFCRVYGIEDVVEKYLSNVYEYLGNDRYTYAEGSTSAGAISYDDLFLYSHHSTDPINGQLCNAFDLVRIHKFGHLDKDPNLAPSKLESMREMYALASTEPEIIREMGMFKIETEEGEDTEWLGQMEIDTRGDYEQTIENFVLILNNDPRLKGVFAYNEFECRDFITRATPWNFDTVLRPCTDKDDAALRHYIEKHYGLFHVAKTIDAQGIVAFSNKFHPVREYVETLEWDGVKRLEKIFIDTLGALDTPYLRAVSKKTLVAAIARIYQPGIKFDYVLTFVGEQGMRKSSLIAELGKTWFSDSLDGVHGKDSYEQLHGVWIIEMAELSGLKKAEIEAVKKFITTQRDRYRVAYGRRVESFPRQCIFFGSTNEVAFLRDPTGNRRFWPVTINKKYVAGTLDVNQIWAEAKVLYDLGESLYLDDELESDASLIQANHSEVDDRAGMIQAYLETGLPSTWDTMNRFERRSYLSGEGMEAEETFTRNKVCVAEIWHEVLKGESKDMNTNSTKFIHSIMTNNVKGWERTGNLKFSLYGYQRAYVRKGTNGEEHRAVLAKESHS